MPDGLRRLYSQGDLHFVTFSCYDRLPLLASQEARTLFVNELARVRTEWHFRLIGYVVMPEHVHVLLSEPGKGKQSGALQVLKQRVSRKLRKLPTPHAGESPCLPSFWQSRFYDFNVYTEGKCKEKLHYMHANPVLRGLVKHPKDWPWSSWAFYYQENCLLAMDPP